MEGEWDKRVTTCEELESLKKLESLLKSWKITMEESQELDSGGLQLRRSTRKRTKEIETLMSRLLRFGVLQNSK